MTSIEIYNELKKEILQLDLTPGTMISEIELTQRYYISRTPIRDVLKKLVSEDLLEVKPHVGSFVSLIDMEKVSDTIFIRQTLEMRVLKELCTTFNLQDALPLQQILGQQAALLTQTSDMDSDSVAWQFMQLDNQFHAKLYELSGKSGVWQTISSLNHHYQRFRTLLVRYHSDSIDTLHAQHQQLLGDLIAHDLDAIEKHTAEHITSGFHQSGEIMTSQAAFFKI